MGFYISFNMQGRTEEDDRDGDQGNERTAGPIIHDVWAPGFFFPLLFSVLFINNNFDFVRMNFPLPHSCHHPHHCEPCSWGSVSYFNMQGRTRGIENRVPE